MPKDTRPAKAKRWCFTLNNYTEEDESRIQQVLTEDNCNFAIVGREVGANGTPHLQGYVNYRNKKHFSTVKKDIGDKAHIEKAKGTDQNNADYCGKELQLLVRVGTPTVGTTERGGCNKRIKDIVQLAQRVSDGANESELLAEGGDAAEAYILHAKNYCSLRDQLVQVKINKSLSQEFESVHWRQWQYLLIRYLRDCVPESRKVIWICDIRGNSGKTYLSKFLVSVMGAIRFENGKSNDIKHAYNGQNIVIFDLSRSQEDHVNYEIIESIKNGINFSPKYDSRMKIFKPPFVVVFANFAPIYNKLSADRWCVRDITETDRLPWGSRECDTDEECDDEGITSTTGRWPYCF